MKITVTKTLKPMKNPLKKNHDFRAATEETRRLRKPYTLERKTEKSKG